MSLWLLLLAQVVDPPAGAGAIAPNPIVVGDEVLLTWVEETKVRLARFKDERRSDPIMVVESAELVANWADFPSAAVRGREIVVHFPEKSAADTYAYDVELARAEHKDRFARVGPLNDDGGRWADGCSTSACSVLCLRSVPVCGPKRSSGMTLPGTSSFIDYDLDYGDLSYD